MFGRKRADELAVLLEIRSELRRIRIAQEEILDVWKCASAVTDPLGEVAPRAPRVGEEITPALKGRKNV